jgi:hypothetical protein
MLFLCPLLLLALLFLAGTVQVTMLTLKKVALQARADVCAVELSVGRKELFTSLAGTNRWLRLTAKGIAIARGAIIFGGPAGALLGSMGERAMLLANQGAFLAQEAKLSLAVVKELGRAKCPANNFSRDTLLCIATPPLLTAFQRERTFYPDVKGGLTLRGGEEELSRVRCQGWSAKTVISLEGDPDLTRRDFAETYVQ